MSCLVLKINRSADIGDEPMNVYRLDPIEPGHPSWRFSDEKDTVWACAPTAKQARELVAAKSGSNRLACSHLGAPVDVMETESAVIALVALPGVEPGRIDVSLDRTILSLSGTRSFPRELDAALIHRLELPQGRFELRVSLPPSGYAAERSTAADGRLTIVLEKLGALAGFCGPEGRTPRRVSAPSARLRLSVADEGRDNNSLSASTPTLTSRERGSFLE